MSASHLELRINANIGYIFLNRPTKGNALNAALIHELTQTLRRFTQEDAVQMVVLAANGNHFCTGADLQWMQQSIHFTEQQNKADAQSLAELLHTLYTFPKPVIAQVHGAVIGGAIGLIACCDLVIAADNTFMQFSEAKLGLAPAIISPYVIQTIGMKAARRYFLTAERFSALHAQQMGLVDSIAPLNELATHVEKFTHQLMQNSPHSLQACKQLICRVANQPITPELLAQLSEQLAQLRSHPETQQLLKAFLQKKGF